MPSRDDLLVHVPAPPRIDRPASSDLPPESPPRPFDRAIGLARAHWLVPLALFLGLVGANAVHSDAGLRSELTALQATIGGLDQEAASMDSKISSLEGMNGSLESENAGLRAENDNLAGQIKAKASLPKLIGKSRDRAQDIADEYGWTLTIKEKESAKSVGTILSQSPKAGTLMSLGREFTVVVAKPFPPKMPNLIGKKQKDAESVADKHGWNLTVKKEASSEPAGTIIRQTPAPGTYMRGAAQLIVWIAKAPAGGQGGDNCTPGYSPCLPPASDYDCWGGSGNGPAYTAPGVVYKVTGSDPYGLDADNDGNGCE
jgi:hypothetical protein